MEYEISNKKKLHRILIRFYPPGLILEYMDIANIIENKTIDLMNLSENSDVEFLVDQIIEKEPLTKKKRKDLEKVIKSK
jgi:dynein assembly factor with WDR repeat domains 1